MRVSVCESNNLFDLVTCCDFSDCLVLGIYKYPIASRVHYNGHVFVNAGASAM